MRNKLLLTVFSVIAMLAIAVSPAYAITGNFVDDNEHPYVGLVAFYDAEWNFLWRCTGTLIFNWTLLTAGHCADTEGWAVYARVWFQQDAGANYDPATQLDPITGYPDYCATGTEGTLCFTSDTILNYDYPGSLRQSRWAGPFEFYITISMIYEVAASFWVVRQRFQKR